MQYGETVCGMRGSRRCKFYTEKQRRSKSELSIPERASAASLQGRVRANKRRGRRNGKKHRGAGEEPQHHHSTKPEQCGVRNAEWELHHLCPQAMEQQHRQKAEGAT
jgi:hypothetical protein